MSDLKLPAVLKQGVLRNQGVVDVKAQIDSLQLVTISSNGENVGSFTRKRSRPALQGSTSDDSSGTLMTDSGLLPGLSRGKTSFHGEAMLDSDQKSNRTSSRHLTDRPANDRKISLADRRVLDKVNSMTDNEVDDLERRYQQYKKEDKKRMQSIRDCNVGDLKKGEARRDDIKQRIKDDHVRNEEVRQAKRDIEEEKEKTRRDEAALREEDRDMVGRRLKRLETLVFVGLFGAIFDQKLAWSGREKRRATYYLTVAQPTLWRGVALAKLQAACRRNLFLRFAIFRYRRRKRVAAIKVIRQSIESRQGLFNARRLHSSTKKIQRWWRHISKIWMARVCLISLQCDALWDQFYEKTLSTSGEDAQSEPNIRYRILRKLLHWKAIEHVQTLKHLISLRTKTKAALDGGRMQLKDLKPADQMLVHSDHVPRLKVLLRPEEILTALDSVHRLTKAFIKQHKHLFNKEDVAREQIEQEEAVRFARFGAIQLSLEHDEVPLTMIDDDDEAAILRGDYDVLTGRRRVLDAPKKGAKALGVTPKSSGRKSPKASPRKRPVA
ncbi:hypothetical protein DIPPA_09265 [Diplonema papillatum]|nr:hypothetical protein DIPPA_09265 [Diplonema papillatum]